MDSGLVYRDIIMSTVAGYGLAKDVITWDNSRGRLGAKRRLDGLCSSSGGGDPAKESAIWA